ncbi:MAG: PaaX family transcriptional regulator [Acidimicrobiia bacterium]
MPDDDNRSAEGPSARALLLTILGEFVLPHGGAAWTRTVVACLGAAGVGERNARQALARVADQGLVVSQRAGRRARWSFTDHGHALLTEGTERIYRFGAGVDDWDDRWLVVLYSVPEEQRARRHQLRSRLAFAGFGFLGAGVALSPHLDREQLATAVLEDLGLLAGAVVLRAEAGEAVPGRELLRRGWDLDALAGRYRRFLSSFGRRTAGDDKARFCALTDLVDQWRRFPVVDPEIPSRLLPATWPGPRAKALFDRRHQEWATGANRYYESFDEPAVPG